MAEKSGINAHLVVTALLASICGFVSSYETIVFAACLLYIREELCLSTKWIQIVASIMYVTGILGNLAAGQVADLLGRKFVIMSSSVSHIIGALVVASSYTRTQVVVGRLFIGLSIGKFSLLLLHSGQLYDSIYLFLSFSAEFQMKEIYFSNVIKVYKSLS
ncbi:putative polyol transporter 6 [Portunus trituberculatus]|uniref:Putative polyol transporter 6 n=1 Tax=Portunus trituberculatus TaxID=210409 RepID=A0A5B7JL11_PORTR|nr:putative polyol transporter 6 [Portunus trituberculatus]